MQFFLVLGVPTFGEGGSTWLGQNPKFFQKVHLRAPLRREGKRETDTRREGKRETDIKREGKKRNRHKKGRKKERKKECQSGMISLVCLCLAVAWEAAKTILDCHFQNLAVVVIYHLPSWSRLSNEGVCVDNKVDRRIRFSSLLLCSRHCSTSSSPKTSNSGGEFKKHSCMYISG